MSDKSVVAVSILDRQYQLACEPDERNSLRQAAELLDERMRSARGGAQLASLEKLAVVTALNIAHELIQQQHEVGAAQQVTTAGLDQLELELAKLEQA